MGPVSNTEYQNAVLEVRTEVEASIGSPVDDDIWKVLVAGKHVNDVVQGGAPVDGLVDKIRAISDYRKDALKRPPTAPREPRAWIPSDVRSRALTEILAIEAARELAVHTFRIEVLQNRLLKDTAAAQRWIKKQTRSDGPPTILAHVPVTGHPTSLERASKMPVMSADEALAAGYGPQLTFVQLNLRWAMDIRIALQGVLGRLKAVGSVLSRTCGWDESDSVLFILTGTVPDTRRASLSRTYGWQSRRRLDEFHIRSQRGVTPREIEALFATARAGPKGTRQRDISEIKARLAAFAAARNDGRKWIDVMTEWNREESDHEYKLVRNFLRDARSAYLWLMGTDLNWVGSDRSRTPPASSD